MTMTIDLYADIVCPWCFIGKRRLASALARLDRGDEVRVRYRSFQLDPALEGEPVGTLPDRIMQRQQLPADTVNGMLQRVSAMAAEEGLAYRLDRARPANTHTAHRLTQLAAESGDADALLERLMRGYTVEGIQPNDHRQLGRWAAEVGLDADRVAAVLDGDDYADAVAADQRHALRLGVQAVPTLAVEDRWLLPAVLPVDELTAALTTVRQQATTVR